MFLLLLAELEEIIRGHLNLNLVELKLHHVFTNEYSASKMHLFIQ